MLTSEDNVLSNILLPSSPVCYFTLCLCLFLLLVLIFLQGPMQVNDKPAASSPPKKNPPKQPSGKPCKVLEFFQFGKDSEPVPYEPKVLPFPVSL